MRIKLPDYYKDLKINFALRAHSVFDVQKEKRFRLQIHLMRTPSFDEFLKITFVKNKIILTHSKHDFVYPESKSMENNFQTITLFYKWIHLWLKVKYTKDQSSFSVGYHQDISSIVKLNSYYKEPFKRPKWISFV